jgi:hypothetical protein
MTYMFNIFIIFFIIFIFPKIIIKIVKRIIAKCFLVGTEVNLCEENESQLISFFPNFNHVCGISYIF